MRHPPCPNPVTSRPRRTHRADADAPDLARLDESAGDGEPGGAGTLEGGDLFDVAERQADVVEPFHQPPAGMFVDLERSPDPRRALRAARALRPSCARRAARTARARRQLRPPAPRGGPGPP